MFVTSAHRLTMTDQQQSPDVERQNLLDRLLDAVKQCQVRFGGKTELATDGDSRVTCLLTQFEAVLQHGLKRSRSRISAFRQVGQAAGIVRPGSDSVFWSFVKEHLGKLDIERFLTLEKATTDGGRGRAWLRSALNEHSLERYFHYMLQNKPLLSQFYERDALMMDEERASMLPMMAAGLSSILFALTVDSDDLNTVRQEKPLAAVNKEVLSNFLPSIPRKPVAEPLPLYSSELSATVENKKKKRKKKKVHAAIVSIEEDASNLAPLDDTRNFSLNDSPVQDNESYYRTSSSGHTRSSSYPGNKTANAGGSTRQTADINDEEILFTEISKSVSLPDNSVAKDEGERNFMKNNVLDYKSFDRRFEAPGCDSLGEVGEEAAVTTGAGENFVFGVVDLFHREAKLEGEKKHLTQNTAGGEYSDLNVSGSATQLETATKAADFVQVEETTACEKSTEANRLSAAEGQIPAVTEEQSLDTKTSLESCYSPPVATAEGDSHLNSSDLIVSESAPASCNEQRFQTIGNVHSSSTDQGEEVVENELDRVEELCRDSDKQMLTSELFIRDPGLESVILLDSGESLIPLMEGDTATNASVQTALDYASDLSAEKDRDSASLSSTSWSCIEEAEDFVETKEELIRGSASSDAAAAAAAAALAVCSDAQRGMVNMNRGFSAAERTAEDRSAYESVNKHEGMSTGELKQAIVSMMLKKDEVEEENRNLDHLLNEERRKSEHLQSEMEDLQNEMKRQENRHSGHIASLTRENELLKHQLKKYVGAVQALRSDSHGTSSEAMEVLSRIRQDEVLPPLPPERRAEEIRLSEEAEEYKRKLIQVADLHGELIEFNEQLQKRLGFYQHQVRRLREELINLRGPLPEDSEIPNDVTKLSDFDPSVISVGTRPLVNVWIPSVFLRGQSSGVHHVYQVYVRIKDDEWNVYRRYSQFLEMHKDLRRKNPVVDSFKFPPKRTLGNKDFQFVEERKRLLQDYIRRVVNLYVTADRQLHDNTTKPTLIHILPFFGDPYPPQKTKNEFSRRKRSAHYTGL